MTYNGTLSVCNLWLSAREQFCTIFNGLYVRYNPRVG
jgi:hypothetical protein